MPDFRRGAAAVAQVKADAEKRRLEGGSFTPFAPSIYWKEDGEEKYVLFINEMANIPTVDLIGYIEQTRKRGDGSTFTNYESVIARTDPAIGEDTDKMVTEWDAKPKATSIAVAVELEPVLEEGPNGRKRPVGFSVKTTEYDRRVRDDDGDLTDDVETVESPVVGFVMQSPHNFFNVLTAYDSNEGPIESTPLKVTKVGTGNSLTYQLKDYPDQPVDVTALIDFIDGVSYIGDDLDDLLSTIEDLSDEEAAIAIGDFLLDKRLEELCDEERYEEIFGTITKSLDKFGNKGKKGNKPATKRERPQRRTQRKSEATPEAEAPAETPEAEAPTEEKPKRTRAKAAPKAEKAESNEEAPAGNDRIAQLRERAAKRKAAAA